MLVQGRKSHAPQPLPPSLPLLDPCALTILLNTMLLAATSQLALVYKVNPTAIPPGAPWTARAMCPHMSSDG